MTNTRTAGSGCSHRASAAFGPFGPPTSDSYLGSLRPCHIHQEHCLVCCRWRQEAIAILARLRSRERSIGARLHANRTAQKPFPSLLCSAREIKHNNIIQTPKFSTNTLNIQRKKTINRGHHLCRLLIRSYKWCQRHLALLHSLAIRSIRIQKRVSNRPVACGNNLSFEPGEPPQQFRTGGGATVEDSLFL